MSGSPTSSSPSVTRYPLFTPDLIELMEELLPSERHDHVATGVTIRAVKP